ncbi:AhpC/TSA family protein [Flavobacterium azooxidireducens]|uniref:AhpC/TSA family protein n=1 Tax=Flavobacterium azooxidireducens TaxID=1871076 RepID=A0ABY4KFH6_9FLAO|nr:TlpA disulfide reductase family protein [Flavobacterium azooxidireducens]UPQ78160.1 AhpC/TSA family protein [Flavobacterium azooxidireducens]
MKKIVVLLITASLFVACNKLEGNEFMISGTAEGISDGKLAILETLDESGMVLKPTDTAVIKNGKFEFKGTTTEPELRFIQLDSVQGKIVFILENGEISIKAFKDSINKSVIGGTFNNEQFAVYNKEQNVIQKKIADYRTVNKEKMEVAMQTNDTVTVNSLRDGFVKLNNEFKDYNVKFAEKNPKAFISVLMIQNMLMQPDSDFEKLEKTFNNLDKSVKDTKPGKNVGELISNRSSAEVGKAAPEFSAPNPEGKMVSLKESLGKVTIIDFWASWCGPCRKENPSVVALYNELHEKGLNIIGVSLDKEGDAQKWQDAITADKLTWPQVSNLKYWNDPVAKKYNVTSIPATFILDATGKIVARDLRGEELKAKVIELLGS